MTHEQTSDVTAAAVRLSKREIDLAAFIRRVAAVPPVAGALAPNTPVYDAYVTSPGPIADLREALRLNLIDGHTYDLALEAMANAGHMA